ncbi:twin-arginine translocation signal domain-containing protein [Halegenticoccus tardaugens]|uniref:twin-arginine translocation signal domain-containing protein n=1 Tax=Halegenticoccus tardaugens TaxID=2071624 RepID=UPI00374402AE
MLCHYQAKKCKPSEVEIVKKQNFKSGTTSRRKFLQAVGVGGLAAITTPAAGQETSGRIT